jgi:cytoskeletal protein CcmA (bactofilin family)
MASLSKFKTLIFVSVLVILISIFNSSSATQFKVVDNFFFPDTSLIQDDLVIAGGNIKLDGTIDGDLISASRSLVQNGLVEGSLNSAAQNLEILGVVNGSVRGFAQNVNVNGQLNRNLIAFCSALYIRPDAEIGKDVTAFCGEMTLDGIIRGNLKGTTGNLVISGVVNQDVSITADRITLMPTAKIMGNFKYKSDKEAKIESGAQISGETVWTKKEPKKEKQPKSIFTAKSLITETLFLLALMITGVVLTLIFKKNAYQAKQVIGDSFLKTLGLGFVFMVCVPIAILILLITIIGIPIAVIALFAYAILIYIAKIPVATFVGNWIIKVLGKQGEPSLIGSMLLGLVILTILLNIPYLEWLIYFVVLFIGFGAILLSQRRSAS